MRFDSSGDKSCMLFGQPERSTGDYTQRGDVFLFVTHRPDETSFDKVSYETGYTYQKDSRVSIRIKDASFELYTDGTAAWTLSVADDIALVEAMRRGATMIVEGTSSRGTLTTDEFSLRGFTAGHRAIGRSCGRP